MKKTIIFAGLILMAAMSLCLTSCGSDDDDDFGGGIDYTSGGIDYTSNEIVEILKGRWDVHGHIKLTSSDTNKIPNLDTDYSGTIEFFEDYKFYATSPVFQIRTYNIDGITYETELRLFSFFGKKYTIHKKNGSVYISFTEYNDKPTSYEIVSINKKGFKLVRDEVWNMQEDEYTPSTLHFEITVYTD